MDVNNKNNGGRHVSSPVPAADVLPPHSILAEQAALGCALASPKDCLTLLAQAVTPEAFYDLHHRTIFEAMVQMNDQDETIDLIALSQCLKDAGQLEQIGGYEYLNKVQDSAPSPANFPSYLKTIQDKQCRRKIIQAGNEWVKKASDESIKLDEVHFQSVNEIAEQLTNQTAGFPCVVDASKFIATPIVAPPELIHGTLHQGGKLVFGGGSKSFKTWCLLDLAISVATGMPWMGIPTKQGKVLFVNFEIQSFAWQQRVVSVSEAKGAALQPGQMDLLNLRGHAADYKKLIPRIIQRARQQGYALIILDPIYKLYGGTDENSAGEVAGLLNEIEHLTVATGAAVAFGAHFAKGNAGAKNAIDRISGSGVFARDPDSLLIFTQHEEDNAFTVEPILRNFPPVAPFAVRWNYPLMNLADDLDPSKLKQTVGRKKSHSSQKLLAVVDKTSPENAISVSAWARAAGVARNTLADYLPEMRLRGWIKTAGEGNTAKQYITNEGKAFLNESSLPEINSSSKQ